MKYKIPKQNNLTDSLPYTETKHTEDYEFDWVRAIIFKITGDLTSHRNQYESKMQPY